MRITTLDMNAATGRLWCAERGTVFADRPYVYALRGRMGDGEPVAAQLTDRNVVSTDAETVVTGVFKDLQIALRQTFRKLDDGLEEAVSLRNVGAKPVVLEDIGLGFAAALGVRPEWRLCAIPFRVQLDGTRHDYAVADLVAGRFQNAVYKDPAVPVPPLTEDGRLRSEAWAWWLNDHGLVVIKYNNSDIELSVAAPIEIGGEPVLRFGGVGSSLHAEPSTGHHLAPGREFTFGPTYYHYLEGPVTKAFRRYRDFTDARGHGFPADYDPPVNWNELYDIGWYHSDAEQLKAHYTRDALLREAEKARACGCELLYLDPGWEVAEGMTLWDESRLGSVADLVAVLRRDYGLALGFRTILRCYRDYWDHRYLVQHAGKPKEPVPWDPHGMWEPCICGQSFREQKIERIRNIAREGVRFLMVDEMDWRGPCSDPDHGHAVPTYPVDHVRAVYALCRELRQSCPELVIECHDPVWPWHTCVYVPTYFRQGFGKAGDYDENWGFEYMWNCIADLKTGKALALYYYNLACSIPLYLHITMAADNDACVFFWWAASTVRHLGIGGRCGHETVNVQGKVAPHDPEKRFAAYTTHMALYRRLKPYFVRGVFHGLDEHIHLHTIPNRPGGVLVLFNLTEAARTITATVGPELLQSDRTLPVEGAAGRYEHGQLVITVNLPPLSPAVVRIGDAVLVENS